MPVAGKRWRQPGFALVGVLLLSLLVSAAVPLMFALNRENIAASRREQVRALAAQQARHAFLVAHAYMLMHSGLPAGWRKGSNSVAETQDDLEYCSGYAGQNGEDWGREDARVFHITLGESAGMAANSRLMAGIVRADRDDLPYEKYVVIGCVITSGPYAVGASLRGEFAFVRQKVMLLRLSGDTT